MPRSPRIALVCLSLATLPLLSGCGGFSFGDLLDTVNSVTVEVVNDTDFFVAPLIFFDDDAGFFNDLFSGARLLDTGLLAPGEALVFQFTCDELEVIFSDGAEQVDDLGTFAIAEPTATLVRGEDFFCGDRLQFFFIGEEIDFGVVVSVNGFVVD